MVRRDRRTAIALSVVTLATAPLAGRHRPPVPANRPVRSAAVAHGIVREEPGTGPCRRAVLHAARRLRRSVWTRTRRRAARHCRGGRRVPLRMTLHRRPAAAARGRTRAHKGTQHPTSTASASDGGWKAARHFDARALRSRLSEASISSITRTTRSSYDSGSRLEPTRSAGRDGPGRRAVGGDPTATAAWSCRPTSASWRHRTPVAYPGGSGCGARSPPPTSAAGIASASTLGAYDRTRPLVIDPSLELGTYVGGNMAESLFRVAPDGAAA